MILWSCGDPDCRNEIQEEHVSPDGSIKLVVFSRDCGATTGFNTQVSVLPIDTALPDSPGNTLIMKRAYMLAGCNDC